VNVAAAVAILLLLVDSALPTRLLLLFLVLLFVDETLLKMLARLMLSLFGLDRSLVFSWSLLILFFERPNSADDPLECLGGRAF